MNENKTSASIKKTGELIRQLRIDAGYTQKTLANELHITDKAISKWERGICLPEMALLPKLSRLLDTDVEMLISQSPVETDWVGLIDIQQCDYSQTIYDKPLVYYLLTHYLLLDITTIYVQTSESNQNYLREEIFDRLGFQFHFEKPVQQNAMILNHPWFLFGSDLTQQFQGAMLSKRRVKLVPENQGETFIFSPSSDIEDYFENKAEFMESASPRTLGRGMVCLDMGDYDKSLDVSSFVRTYQQNSGLLIGSIEEIAFRTGRINESELREIAEQLPYREMLSQIADNKPQVG